MRIEGRLDALCLFEGNLEGAFGDINGKPFTIKIERQPITENLTGYEKPPYRKDYRPKIIIEFDYE